MSDVVELIGRNEKLAKEYEWQEFSAFQFDTILKDGSHTNPNCERARQSKLAHQETANLLRHIAGFVEVSAPYSR